MGKIAVAKIDSNGNLIQNEPIKIDKSQVLLDSEGLPRKDIVYPNIEEYQDVEGIYVADVGEGLNSPKFDLTNLVWIEGKSDADLLLEAQLAKMKELEGKCEETIIKGFDYTINTVSYHFSMSLSAQSNFQETGDMFKEGLITSEKWTVFNNDTGKIERISLDEATFKNVRGTGRSLVRDNVSKLRDTLEPQVWSATTVADVEAIVW